MEKILIRPSGVNSFFDCSYRWYRDNIYKPIRRVGVAAHFGTSLHKVGETYYNEVIKSQTWQNYNSSYEDIAVETLREKCKEEEPSDLESLAQLNPLEAQLRCKSKLYVEKAKELNKEIIPIAVEKQYRVELKNKNIELKGTLDVVGKDYIIDIKTMNKLNNPIKYIMQQGIYAFLREHNKEPVKDLIIHRVLTSKNYIDSESILNNTLFGIDNIIEKSKFYLKVIINTTEEFLKSGNEDIFRGNPTSMLCSSKYCPYYNECRYKGF